MNNKTLGIISILLASILWSIEPIFLKLSCETSDFVQTNAIRAVFALLVAFIYILIRRKPKELKLDKKDIAPMVYIAIATMLFADLMYVYSLTLIPVVNAVVIGHLQPVFIVIFGFFVLKSDKLNTYDYIGILLLVISGILVTTGTLENLLNFRFGTFGDLVVLAAAVAWATGAIVARKYLTHLDCGVLSFYRFSVASIVLLIYLIVNNKLFIDNYYQVIIGVIVGLGMILYYESITRIKAAQTSALELSTPLFATVLAFLFLYEAPTIMQIIGVVVLLFGIYFISKKEG